VTATRTPTTPLARRIDVAMHWLQKSRTFKGLAVDPVAFVLARVPGATAVGLSRWRSGEAAPPDEVLPALAGALGLTPHWLRTGDRRGEIVAPFSRTASRERSQPC
jgi:transcriptional regulator with XRE-family HTH domain